MGGVLHGLLSAPPLLVYLVVGLLVFGEAAVFAGFVLPGETAAVLGGVIASRQGVDLRVLIVLVVLCAIVGDTVGYEIGKHVGPRLLQWRVLDKRRRRLDDAQEYLARRGGSAVLLGRWVAFFRAVMPALAGTARMRYRTFLTWNATGGIIWGAATVTAGFLAGASYARVEKAMGRGGALVVLVIAVVALVVWRVRRHRAEAAAER